jgi:hypothetical protein
VNAEVSIKEVSELGLALFAQREVVDRIEAELADAKKVFEELKAKMIATFDKYEMEKWSQKGHGTISKRQNLAWKMPKEHDQREAFFAFLRERNAYDELITVNHQTLNSFCKEELEKAIEADNIEFSIPGLGEPSSYVTLQIRKG